MDEQAERILSFWFDEVGPDGWYTQSADLDSAIEKEFGETIHNAQAGQCDHWKCGPRGCLALVILLDQFPRNIYRNDGRAFAFDEKARAVARYALDRGYDLSFDMPERMFYYMPFMHSESLSDQERSVRLALLRAGGDLDHARAHRLVIRRFGRFPYRNDALGRTTTEAEAAFLEDGGYRAALAEARG